MPFNNPRTYDFLLEGIAWSHTDQELDRLEVFARAHFKGVALQEIATAIARQRLLNTSRRRPADVAAPVHQFPDPLERMMDEIAAASSVAEVDYLTREVDALFAGHPRRAELDQALDGRRRLLARALGS